MADLSLLVVAATTVAVVVGALVTIRIVEAARRTDAASLWLLGSGIGLITIGIATWDAVVTLSAPALDPVVVAGSLVIAFGFVVLGYSLFVGEAPG